MEDLKKIYTIELPLEHCREIFKALQERQTALSIAAQMNPKEVMLARQYSLTISLLQLFERFNPAHAPKPEDV